MKTRNRVGIGCSYRPASPYRRNRFLGSLKVLKYRLWTPIRVSFCSLYLVSGCSPTGPLYFVSVVFTPSPPQPPVHCLGPACYLPTLKLTLYRKCGLALTYDGRGFVKPNKKTIVGLSGVPIHVQYNILNWHLRSLQLQLHVEWDVDGDEV